MAYAYTEEDLQHSAERRETYEYRSARESVMLRLEDSEYTFDERNERAHFTCDLLEESWGTHYCCHNHRVLGVK